MHNLFIKRLKSRRKLFFGSSSIFFYFIFDIKHPLSFLLEFFSQIFLYSYGYNNHHFYSSNDVCIKEAIKLYTENDIALSYDIEDDAIIFQAFVSPNTFLEEYGIRLTSRLFVNMKVKEKGIFSNMENMDYCLVSENYGYEGNTLEKNGKKYPIQSTFQLKMTSAVINSLKTSNIKDLKLALFVEKAIDKEESAQIIVNGHEDMAKKHNLVSFWKSSQ